ncbi:MAG: SDR family NAD(P)-dependent oxidoreductase, partial [Rubrivivax sp.]
TFAASGLVSLVSLVQAMKHELIPPSLNCEQDTDYIDWDSSPFYVNKQARPWTRSAQGRWGAVSAFGMSGTNAHVVVQSHDLADEGQNQGPGHPMVLALSAKTEAALQEKVRDLVEVLQTRDWSAHELRAMSLTLLTGRQHFAHRCAVVVHDREDALHVLKQAAGKEKLPNLFRGTVARDFSPQTVLRQYGNELLARLADMQADDSSLDDDAARDSLCGVADLYCMGYELAWERLFGPTPPRRISLPGYPFARERHWVHESRVANRAGSPVQTSQLHPLVHRNTSDLDEQRFSSSFTGQEFFFQDQPDQGPKMLPGLVQLELARAALILGQKAQSEGMAIQLEDVVFAHPVAIGAQGLEVHIALERQDAGVVAFEIYTGEGEDAVVHTQGLSVLVAQSPDWQGDALDLQRLRDQCVDRDDSVSAMPTLVDLRTGRDARGRVQALAELRLPSAWAAAQPAIEWHPGLMAGVLACMAVVQGAEPLTPVAPVSLAMLESLAAMPERAWIWVRDAQNGPTGDATRLLDVDVLDEQGRLCVRFHGLGARTPGSSGSELNWSAAVDVATRSELTFCPGWDVVTVARQVPHAPRGLVVVGGDAERQAQLCALYPDAQVLNIDPRQGVPAITECLRSAKSLKHLLWIVPASGALALDGVDLIESQQAGVVLGFKLVKSLLAMGRGHEALELTVVTQQAQSVSPQDRLNPAHASVHGLVGSLAKEHPQWQVRLVDLPSDGEWPWASVWAQPAQNQGQAAVYRQGLWYEPRLLSCALPAHISTRFRQGGVYVIVGGAGRLGELLSDYLIHAHRAQVVWLDRQVMDDALARKCERMAVDGVQPCYITVDATDRVALQAAHAEIKSRFGAIHGLVHAASQLQDQAQEDMDESLFKEMLSAKVDASVNMAAVFGEEPLDLVLFFSALQSFSKSAGHGSDAAGCTFVDAYAQALAEAWPCPVKVVNGGYWGRLGELGDVLKESDRSRIAHLGLASVEPREAMAALERLVSSDIRQVALFKTEHARMGQALGVLAGQSLSVTPRLPALPMTLPTHTGVALTVDVDDVVHQVQAFDALLGCLMWGQLQSLGLFGESPIDVAAWSARVKLPKVYQPWLQESLRLLCLQGYLGSEGGELILQDKPAMPLEAAWREWDVQKALWTVDANRAAQVTLVETMLKALPDILMSRQAATKAMFPNGSMQLVEGIYKNNALSDYFNEVLAESLIAYIEARIHQDPQVRLRLVEIGAGTGGTSALLFKHLAAYAANIAEYCYTDISKAFLVHAQQNYASQAPYLKTTLFNVEAPLAGQDIAAESFDLAIATNVLHATRDICNTVRNAKALLKGGGLLLVNDLSQSDNLFLHLTFGLLEGWWLYEDGALRLPGSPGLSPEVWQEVLAAEGLPVVSSPAQRVHKLGQQIIVAQSDGLIRQAQPKAAEPTSRRAPEPAARAAVPRHEMAAPRHAAPPHKTGATLRSVAIGRIRQIFATTLGLAHDAVDPDENFGAYGLDSILAMQVAQELSAVLVEVNAALMMEYQSVASLTDHFLTSHREALVRWLGEPELVESNRPAEEPPARRPAVQPQLQLGRARPTRRSARDAVGRDARQDHGTMDIAVIGISGRYADANDLGELWDNLQSGRDCIREVPADRWSMDGFYSRDKDSWKSYCKWGGFFKDVGTFDPAFFNVDQTETMLVSRKEWLFLETVWNTFESAGYTRQSLKDAGTSNIGVFVGSTDGEDSRTISTSGIANRISGFWKLTGPSVIVDSMSASSMTAIHMACESIARGECDAAIAGGVMLLYPELFIKLSLLGSLGSSAASRSFSDGDGLLLADGVGAVLLKPLSQAIADQDNILAVIKASSASHSGGGGLRGVPNKDVQAQLIEDNAKKSGIDLRTISYVEAAANGSVGGDISEVAALSTAFRKFTDEKQFCPIGSVKSYIGHASAASGISQLSKVILQLQHQQLASTKMLAPLNPGIKFENSAFYLLRDAQHWGRPKLVIDGVAQEVPRRAIVNSYGAGGSYVSLIVEEFKSPDLEVDEQAEQDAPEGYLIPLSAASKEALGVVLDRLSQFVESEPGYSLRNLAYTLQVGRQALEHRWAVVVHNKAELAMALRNGVTPRKVVDMHAPAILVGNSRDRDTWNPFLDADAEVILIDRYTQNGDLNKIGLFWVNGGVIPWKALYRHGLPRRMQLPVYPFVWSAYPVKEGIQGSV